jgi:uncharacterized protein YbaP (TraB family)
MFLGGSVHALERRDYPLPAAYTRAFDASTQLTFEYDPKDKDAAGKGFLKAGRYSKGDSLKNHVDPRTYDYVRRFFALLNIPEKKFKTFRPWFIELMLEAPPTENYELGVESFLTKRAQAASKQISGLESLDDAIEVFSGMSDQESEAVLLLFFVNFARQGRGGMNMVSAWRRGDAEALAVYLREVYKDVPDYRARLVDARNRKWIPKLEGYLRSGRTYFVVTGAGHMGGPNGVLALLRARGCSIEQL